MKYLKPFGTQNFVLGVGIAALTYMLGPTIKRNAKMAAVKGMQGAMFAGNTVSEAMGSGKEKMGAMVGSAMNQQGQHLTVLYNELKADREQLNELTSMVYDLKEQISNMQGQVEQ